MYPFTLSETPLNVFFPKSRPKAAKEGSGPDKNMLVPAILSRKDGPFCIILRTVLKEAPHLCLRFLLRRLLRLPGILYYPMKISFFLITPFFIHFFTRTSAQAPPRS